MFTFGGLPEGGCPEKLVRRDPGVVFGVSCFRLRSDCRQKIPQSPLLYPQENPVAPSVLATVRPRDDLVLCLRFRVLG